MLGISQSSGISIKKSVVCNNVPVINLENTKFGKTVSYLTMIFSRKTKISLSKINLKKFCNRVEEFFLWQTGKSGHGGSNYGRLFRGNRGRFL
jgi:hypothetical protein